MDTSDPPPKSTHSKVKGWRKRSQGSKSPSGRNSINSSKASPAVTPIPSPSVSPAISLFPRSDAENLRAPIIPEEEIEELVEVPSTNGYIEYLGDEKIEILPQSLNDIPEHLLQKIIKQGIDVSQLTPKQVLYLFHIVHFLFKDQFPPEVRPFKRIGVQRDFLPDHARQTTVSQIASFDKVSIKKVFPTLDFSSEGGFGQVFTGKMIVDKSRPKLKVAVKKIPHSTTLEMEANINELYFLSHASHANIVKYIGAYYVPADAKLKTKVDQLFIVMEWLEGGTLNQAAKSGARFTDAHIAFIAHECLTAIDYLHSCRWIHRDLKSQNVMLSIEGQVKLIDFGLSCDMRRGRRTKMLGSPFWIPPEMIQFRPHSYPVDIWSLGVCLLEMYLIDPPLRKNPIQCMFTIATQGLAHFIPERASPHAKACLERFLITDPDKRPTAKELLKDPWLKGREEEGLTPILKQVFVMKNLSNMGI